MSQMQQLVIICAAGLLSACTTAGEARDDTLATAMLLSPEGAARGSAMLVRVGDTVALRVNGVSLPAAQHGAHLHTVGKCEAPGFTSAGAHLNPSGKLHGTLNPQGSHLGDLPNIVVASDGTGALSAPLAGTAASLEPVIFDADGTAFVIHAAADDYRTDPSGNSGSRIACGVFVRPG